MKFAGWMRVVMSHEFEQEYENLGNKNETFRVRMFLH